MGQNDHESRLEYWASRSSVRSHRSLGCLLHPTRFARSLAHLAHSLARGKVNDWMVILFFFLHFRPLWKGEKGGKVTSGSLNPFRAAAMVKEKSLALWTRIERTE